MKTFESGFESKDGLRFYVRGWEPDGSPKALVMLVHGLGEHMGRYAHVGEVLTQAGYVLAGFDLRGHGKSAGARGHFPSLDAVMQDLNESLAFLRGRDLDGLPFFIYGHSLGGLLALAFTLQVKPNVKGVVVSAPGLRTALQEQKVKIVLAKVLGSIAPTITLPSGLDPKALSHDQGVVDAYVNDPLVHDKASTGFGKAALGAIDFVFANAANFPAPLLVMYGSEDKLSYPSGGGDFVRLVPGDVTFKLWDGMYHEIHNEPGKAQVFEFVINWLDAHLKGK